MNIDTSLRSKLVYPYQHPLCSQQYPINSHASIIVLHRLDNASSAVLALHYLSSAALVLFQLILSLSFINV